MDPILTGASSGLGVAFAQALVEAAMAEFGRIDILVINAGVGAASSAGGDVTGQVLAVDGGVTMT